MSLLTGVRTHLQTNPLSLTEQQSKRSIESQVIIF